ncbi:hypothetical protein INT47_008145, partial [Mucor saturninus]
NIQKLNDVPYFVKEEIQRLLSLAECPEEESSSFNVNITAHNSNFYNAFGSGTLIFNQQQQSAERAQQQKDVEPALNMEHSASGQSDKEKSDEEDNIPSDRTSNESKWMLNDICISDLCLRTKEASFKLAKGTDSSRLKLEICLYTLKACQFVAM